MHALHLALVAALACTVAIGCVRDPAEERKAALPGSLPGARPDAEAAVEPSDAAMAPAQPEGAAALSRERLLRVPEGSLRDPALYPGLELERPATAGAERPRTDRLAPSLSVESETADSPIPGVAVESHEVRGGLTVSPDRNRTAVSVEGAVRQDTYDREAAETRQDHSVGVRVEVPWPTPEER
jgi:hypothetical protein